MKIKVIFLLLVVISAIGINNVSGAMPIIGMHIYEATNVKDQPVTIQVKNMSISANYDLAIVNTRNVEPLYQIMKYPGMKSPHLLARSSNSGASDENITYTSTVDTIYILVFDRNVIFKNTPEGTYILTSNVNDEDFTDTTFTSLEGQTFKYLQGTELQENGDGKLNSEEYKTYTKSITAGESLITYLTEPAGDIGLFLAIGSPSPSTISRIITSIRNYIANTTQPLPSVEMFDTAYADAGYLTYHAGKDTSVTVVVFSLNYTANKDQSFTYKLWSNLPIGSQNTGKWYSAWFINWMHSTNYDKPPIATFVLLFISLATSLFSAGVTRLLVDLDELNMYQEKINKHNKMKSKAKNTADKKLWAKVQARESLIQDFQKKMVFKRMLPQLFITLPFFIIFPALRGALGDPRLNLTPDRGGILAVLPFFIPNWVPIFGKWVSLFAENTHLTALGFGFWYFVSAIMSSVIIQRIFGINIQGTKQQNPFSQK